MIDHLGGTLHRGGPRQRAFGREPLDGRLALGTPPHASRHLHLTCPSRRHGKDKIVVHFARLTPVDAGVRDGIPVTSVPRTLLDLAPKSTPRQLDGLLDRAEERKRLDVGRIESVLARVPGHRGRLPLQAALSIYKPEPATLRSGLELRFRELLAAAGPPLPAANYIVGPYELDCYWEDERFAVELDVFATHGSPLVFETDRERADDLLAIGIEMTRVTDVRLAREPNAVVASVAGHLDRRRRGAAAGRAPARRLGSRRG